MNGTKVCSLQRERRRFGDTKITVEHGEVLLNSGVLLRRQTEILGITDALSKWDLNRKKEIWLQSIVRHVLCPITFLTVYSICICTNLACSSRHPASAFIYFDLTPNDSGPRWTKV